MTTRNRHHSVRISKSKQYKNDKLPFHSFSEIPHGNSSVRVQPKFSLGGKSKIGITRKIKTISKKVRKFRANSARINRVNTKHHITKEERKARGL